MADEENDEELRKYIKQLIREEGGGVGGGVGGSSDGGGNRRGGGNNGGVDLGEFGKFVAAAKGMKEAMTSDVDKALSTAVSSKIVDQVIPSMSPQPRASAGFLDTGFAIAFAQKLPEQLASLVDVFFTRLGPDRTGRLIDGIQQKFIGGGSGSGGAGGTKQLTEDDILSSLDPDNPAHLHQYMAYKNLNDPDIAKRTLIAERDKALKRMYSGTSGDGAVGAAGAGMSGDIAGAGIGTGTNAGLIQMLEGQNAVLKDLIQAKAEDRKVMEALFNEINSMKKERGGDRSSERSDERSSERSDERSHDGREDDFDINNVDNGKHVDELGLPKKDKVLKEIKSKDLPIESNEPENLVHAVKLEDVVIKNVSKKVGDVSVEVESGSVEVGNGSVEVGNGKVEGGSVEMENRRVENNKVDKKTSVIMKKGGSKPKFE